MKCVDGGLEEGAVIWNEDSSAQNIKSHQSHVQGRIQGRTPPYFEKNIDF
jgi:hypothetical protein